MSGRAEFDPDHVELVHVTAARPLLAAMVGGASVILLRVIASRAGDDSETDRVYALGDVETASLVAGLIANAHSAFGRYEFTRLMASILDDGQ